MNKKNGIWIILLILVIADLLTWFDTEAESTFCMTVSILFLGVYTVFCLKEWISLKQEIVLSGLFGLTAIVVLVLRYYESNLLSAVIALLAGVFHPIALLTSFLAKKAAFPAIILIVYFSALIVIRMVKEHLEK